MRNLSKSQSVDRTFLDELRGDPTIRETLRQWEAEHHQPNSYTSHVSLGPGEVANHLFRSEPLSGVREGRQLEEAEDGIAVDETGAAESLPVMPKEHLVPGTLIELRYVPRAKSDLCRSVRR